MNKTARIIAIAALPVVLFANPIIYLDDDLSDGDRTNQNLPSSAQWFGSWSNLEIVEKTEGLEDYALKNNHITGTAVRHAAAYFAPDNDPVTLAAGERIVLSADVTPLTKDPDDAFNVFRMAIMDSGTSRLTTDENPDLVLNGGYGMFNNPVQPRNRLYFRNNQEKALIGSLTAWDYIDDDLGDLTDGFAMVQNTTYGVMMEVERLADGNVQIIYSLSDGEDSFSSSWIDETHRHYSFDTIAFGWGGAFGDGLVENVQITFKGPFSGFYTWAAGYGLSGSDAEPDLDFDGDGFTNWQEYIARTDPADPESYFSAKSVTREGSVSKVSFFSSLDRLYEFWFTPDLSGKNGWERVRGPRPGTGKTDLMIHEQEEESVSGFYRIAVLSELPPGSELDIEGPDRVIGDFSGPDWGTWTASGTAFGDGPRDGVASSEQAERDVYGTLTSPEFIIGRRYINFLVGGEVNGAEVRLICNGVVVRSVRGGTPEELHPWSWNVEDLIGSKARIEIRDFPHASARPHAYIMASDIRLSNTSSLGVFEKELVLEHRFLNVPAAHTGRNAFFAIELEGALFRRSNDDGSWGHGGGLILPENGEEGYWLAMDLLPHVGKRARIRLENFSTNRSDAVEQIYTSPEPHQEGTLYRERLRPQFHFSPRTGWLNDPNGLVYHDGIYHLFFQHNALGLLINNQSWGHAVSQDLFHWEERPSVMEPFSFSKGRSFSGSAVIDKQNRAGFGHNAMIAIYTDTAGGLPGYAEVIAYSLDQGKTFTYYEGNPVYRNAAGRDPKVIWWPVSDTEQTDPDGHWVMVVYSRIDGVDHARILISEDLKNWTQTDQVPDHYECVELFELPVLNPDGEPTGEKKWILQGGNGTYHLGHFDGRIFHPDSPVKQRTVQNPGYAWQRFNHAPDGRIIAIAWIRRHTDWEEMPFSQMMSIPLELTLRETPLGLRIHAAPVEEMDALRENIFREEGFSVGPGESVALPGTHQQVDLEVRFKPEAGSFFRIDLGADSVVWSNGRLDNRHDLPANPDGTVVLRIILDRPLIEVIGNDGYLYYPLHRNDQGEEVGISLSGGADVLHCRLDRVQSTMVP